MKHTAWMATAALLLASAATPQTLPASPIEHALVAQQAHTSLQAPKIERPQPSGVPGGMRVAVHRKIVRGAPYSADKYTESVQVLADGNRIVHRTVSRVWRDSEGRTRTEETGPQGAQSVTITDPASGETWVLDPQTRTAFRAGVFVYDAKGEGKVTITTTHPDGAQAPAPPPPPPPPPASAGAVGVPGGLVRVEEGVGAVGVPGGLLKVEEGVKAEGKVTREDLGQQQLEGLAAIGTRTTTVIPAGAIGNEQPIRIVSEQWYSPELQMLVATKFSDPRSGETTFRLTNVSRAEPDRSLFTVPPDYTVKESEIQRQPL